MLVPEIKQLIQEGKYDQAMSIIDGLSEEDELNGLIMRIRLLQKQGKLKEAGEISEATITKSQDDGSKLQQLVAQIYFGYLQTELFQLEDLACAIENGEKLLNKLKQEKSFDLEEYEGSIAFLRGNLHFERGETEEAIENLEKSLLIKQGLENFHDVAESLIQLGWVHLNVTGKQNLAHDYFERSLAISEKIGNKTLIAHSYNVLGVYNSETGDHDKALTYYEKSSALYQSMDNKIRLSTIYNNIAVVYQGKEKYDLALDYYQKFLKTNEELGRDYQIALAYGNIGWVYGFKGDMKQMLDYNQRALSLHEKIGNVQGITFATTSIAEAYLVCGELSEALKWNTKVKELSEVMKSEIRIASALLRFSKIYTLQGETGLALENANQSFLIFDKLDIQIGILNCKIQLGIVNKLLGNYLNALEYLESGNVLYKKIIIGGWTALWGSYIIFHIILIFQDLNDIDSAREYLSKLKKIETGSKSKYVKQRSRFSEAIIRKMSKRGIEKLQAQQIFREIIADDVLDHSITVLSMLNLCELLILEILISDTAEELFEEVTELSYKLKSIAEEQNSSMLIVMSLLLQTKLALVQGEFEEANDHISFAKQIATEKKLSNLLLKVKYEQEKVQSELDKWNELVTRKASIKERIEQARVVDYLNEAKKIQESWVQPTIDMMNQ